MFLLNKNPKEIMTSPKQLINIDILMPIKSGKKPAIKEPIGIADTNRLSKIEATLEIILSSVAICMYVINTIFIIYKYR